MSATDFAAIAREHWGASVPDWVVILAEDATRLGLKRTAGRISYSVSTVSEVIRAKYRGRLPDVEERVRGALMGATVDCPVSGEIGRDACLDHQKAPFAATNSHRIELYRACRGGCPHSRLKEADDAQL